MFERIRAIIKENIIIIILEFNKLEPTSSILREGKPSRNTLRRTVLACSLEFNKLKKLQVIGEGHFYTTTWDQFSCSI